MCSTSEALDRESCMEISLFEATPSTYNLKIKERIPDPQRCVKKYRRSAAGGGVRTFKNETPRTENQLYTTVQYLTSLLSSPRTSCSSKTQNYISDRFRAISVDIVQSRLEGRDCLRVMAKFGVFGSYVFGELESGKFEGRFNMGALQSCLSMLREVLGEDDGVLSLTGLLHFTGVVSGMEGLGLDGGEGLGGLCGLVPEGGLEEGKYEKLKFVFDLSEAWSTGNYHKLLTLLTTLPPTSPHTYLTRFITSRALPQIRFIILQNLNKSLGKGEKVLKKELARLLFFKEEDAAVRFAGEYGVMVMEGGEGVVMKLQSVEEINLEFKRDDDFVFGELKNDIINGPDEDNVMTLKPQFIDWLLYDDS
ncbi:hypothetical protein TrLO_g4271 [Triparma laevis f. longispina]|uniref:SAC3/GANP/THP3 conserved domain-containing protein n=1 Tax=Triparma laevis f. longispina TaxID=1714387 RepID=A0A9W6ZAU9_9STRA|nr:hypothetical protein TrLO_g4271 [Triparma laevis f. longispina]